MKHIAVIYLPAGEDNVKYNGKQFKKNGWKMIVIEHPSIKKVKVKIYSK